VALTVDAAIPSRFPANQPTKDIGSK
jgi:hypothetical protein